MPHLTPPGPRPLHNARPDSTLLRSRLSPHGSNAPLSGRRASTREPPVRCSEILGSARSFYNRVCSLQQRRRDRKSNGCGDLSVDHQLESRRLLDGEVCGGRALEDLVSIARGITARGEAVDAVGEQGSRGDESSGLGGDREAPLGGARNDPHMAFVTRRPSTKTPWIS